MSAGETTAVLDEVGEDLYPHGVTTRRVVAGVEPRRAVDKHAERQIDSSSVRGTSVGSPACSPNPWASAAPTTLCPVVIVK